MTQEQALDIWKLGYNVFLTGPPGSGKTFLLNKYIDYLKKRHREVAITASTGIAATHMNGITIHSWSGLGVKEKLTEQDIKKLLLMCMECQVEMEMPMAVSIQPIKCFGQTKPGVKVIELPTLTSIQK